MRLSGAHALLVKVRLCNEQPASASTSFLGSSVPVTEVLCEPQFFLKCHTGAKRAQIAWQTSLALAKTPQMMSKRYSTVMVADCVIIFCNTRNRREQRDMPRSRRNDNFIDNIYSTSRHIVCGRCACTAEGEEAGCRAGTASPATRWTAACSLSARRPQERLLLQRRSAKWLWPCSEMAPFTHPVRGVFAWAWHLWPLLPRQEPAPDVPGSWWTTRSSRRNQTQLMQPNLASKGCNAREVPWLDSPLPHILCLSFNVTGISPANGNNNTCGRIPAVEPCIAWSLHCMNVC